VTKFSVLSNNSGITQSKKTLSVSVTADHRFLSLKSVTNLVALFLILTASLLLNLPNHSSTVHPVDQIGFSFHSFVLLSCSINPVNSSALLTIVLVSLSDTNPSGSVFLESSNIHCSTLVTACDNLPSLSSVHNLLISKSQRSTLFAIRTSLNADPNSLLSVGLKNSISSII